MAVTFEAVSTIGSSAVIPQFIITTPTVADNDIIIVVIYDKGIQAPFTDVSGTFTSFFTSDAGDIEFFWKRATDAGDSGVARTFQKGVDDNLLFCGVMYVFRGCKTAVNPIDATAPSKSANASSDTVTYASFNPTATDVHVVAIGIYAEDQTTMGTIAGTNPVLSNRSDLETPTGTDASFFLHSGNNDGTATGVRTHSTTSTIDAESLGVMFGLLPQVPTFPTQYSGLRTFYNSAVVELCLVATADAPASMGGVIKINKNGTLYSVYLVETGDTDASSIRIKTSTGVKAFRKKT